MLAASKAPSKTKQNELFAMEVNKMTKMHLVYIMYERAKAKLQSKGIKDANVTKIFMTVLANFALKQLLTDNISLYESGFFGPGSGDLLDAAYK